MASKAKRTVTPAVGFLPSATTVGNTGPGMAKTVTGLRVKPRYKTTVGLLHA